MDTSKVNVVELNETPQNSHPNPKQNASRASLSNKYSDSRDAKKKRRRTAHRAVLRRSHTNG